MYSPLNHTLIDNYLDLQNTRSVTLPQVESYLMKSTTVVLQKFNNNENIKAFAVRNLREVFKDESSSGPNASGLKYKLSATKLLLPLN
jgi:hypothetical protein